MTKFKEWKERFGVKVLVRSNEDEPLIIGQLVGFAEIRDEDFPVVNIDGDNTVCMSIVIPYSEEVFDALNFLDPKRQWEIMRDISIASQMRHRKP